MFFELFNILTSFQGYIDNILTQKFKIFVIFNLDNIFIYIKDLDQNYLEILD